MKKILLMTSVLVSLVTFVSYGASFEKSGEYYRYFKDDGSVAYDEIIEYDRDKYYVNSDGYAVFNSWVKKDTGYYYAGSDGKLVKSGIKEIDGYKYYFNDNYELQKGWCGDYDYYGDEEDGYLLTGFQELYVPKDWYVEDERQSNAWFYFDTVSCKKYKAEDDPYVSKMVGESKYCFDQNGIMRMGWRKIKDTTPVMKGYMYFVEESTDEFKFGEAVTDTWYAIEPPKEVLSTNEVKYFYFNGQGVPRCAKEGSFSKVRLGDKTFLFNEYGYAVYGVRVVDNNYYYFGPSVEDCSMKTGVFTKDINNSGESTSYYFEDSGIGFTGVHQNKLYYKGKLQKASSEQRYAAFNVGGFTRLVNTAGTIMKNKSKLKDGDGYYWWTNSSGAVTRMKDEEEDVPIIVTEAEPPEVNTEQ